MNALPIYDDKCIKTKIITYEVNINFHGLNVPAADVECETFTVISIDSILVYENKYKLEVYLDSCAYKIVNTQMADYLGDSLFESD